jgi:hypothetical protein
MQIEETFRDKKSHRWGFGLHYARCNNGRRLEVLLLIAHWRFSFCGWLAFADELSTGRVACRPIPNGGGRCSLPSSWGDSSCADRLWSCRSARSTLRWRSSEPSSWPPCLHEICGDPSDAPAKSPGKSRSSSLLAAVASRRGTAGCRRRLDLLATDLLGALNSGPDAVRALRSTRTSSS